MAAQPAGPIGHAATGSSNWCAESYGCFAESPAELCARRWTHACPLMDTERTRCRGDGLGNMPALQRRRGGRALAWTIERARPQIAFLYLDLGFSAAQCAEQLYVSSSVVLRRLATCGIARRAAGGSPPRLDHRDLQRTAFLYERFGLSLTAMARIEGIQPNAVRHRLRAAGVALRPRGGRRPVAVRTSFG